MKSIYNGKTAVERIDDRSGIQLSAMKVKKDVEPCERRYIGGTKCNVWENNESMKVNTLH